MVRLSVLGETVTALAPPTTTPTCADPDHTGEACGGEMRPTTQTVTIPMGGGTLALLRCERCRASRYYRLHQAYALMPADLEF